MPRWHVLCSDLLDIFADGLICSANPQLNLSGGVGGAFSLRYGPAMQEFLHNYLRERQLKSVPAGSVIVTPGFGSHFRWIAHAVAIDVFYDTNAELIVRTYREAFAALASAGCSSVAAACLGCGYGRCPEAEFLKSIQSLIANPPHNVDDITLATTNQSLTESLQHLLAAVAQVLAQQ